MGSRPVARFAGSKVAVVATSGMIRHILLSNTLRE
jgi:hypothetical protein